MSRTNRNNRNSSDYVTSVSGELEAIAYPTAAYTRLSVRDNGCGSDSIENQIYMIEKFVRESPELSLVSTYVDNGMTGTNFDRPGFLAMLEDAKNGRIRCIVVKDLSRLGRNYMETGNYLERIFPLLGVRFISINDQYDSFHAGNNEMLALSLKNVYHHLYAKDISRKISTLFDVKKKNGLFLGRFAPYGYKKSEINRYRLVIDEDTEPVICDIYRMYLNGMKAAAIAKKLNDMGVKSRLRLLYEAGDVKGSRGESQAVWSTSSVLGILRNPNYCGCIVERKSEGAYYQGGKRRMLPKSEWKYIENTHEAIISWDEYNRVQQMLGNAKI